MSDRDLNDRLTKLESSIVHYENELNHIKSLIHEHNNIFKQLRKNQKTLEEESNSGITYDVTCKDCNDTQTEECY
jgi:uncharacterized coiled-coil protein SlyX